MKPIADLDPKVRADLARRARPLLVNLAENAGIVAKGLDERTVLTVLRDLIDAQEGVDRAPHTFSPSPVGQRIVQPSERFAYVTPTPAQVTRMHVLRSGFTMLTQTVEEACKPGRYLSLTLTALEEAAMWANKSVSHDP